MKSKRKEINWKVILLISYRIWKKNNFWIKLKKKTKDKLTMNKNKLKMIKQEKSNKQNRIERKNWLIKQKKRKNQKIQKKKKRKLIKLKKNNKLKMNKRKIKLM